MKVPVFIDSWLGVDLMALDEVKKLPKGAICGPAVYSAIWQRMAALETNTPVLVRWRAERSWAGEVLDRVVIKPFEAEHGTAPKILSVAAGSGQVEAAWVERGLDVTLQDCQEHILVHQPEGGKARWIFGDVREALALEEYDFILMIGLDYALTDDELAGLLERLSSNLLPGGKVVLMNHCNLSLRRWGGRARDWLLHRLGMRIKVPWGWFRTPSAIRDAATRSGLVNCKLVEIDGPKASWVIARFFERMSLTFQGIYLLSR
jgi:hypothetical protein